MECVENVCKRKEVIIYVVTFTDAGQYSKLGNHSHFA